MKAPKDTIKRLEVMERISMVKIVQLQYSLMNRYWTLEKDVI